MCDSVDEARALAYSADERHKVVAADGTMISKNGFMTGGLTGNESARASRWNDSALEGLKQVRCLHCSLEFREIWRKDLFSETMWKGMPQVTYSRGVDISASSL